MARHTQVLFLLLFTSLFFTAKAQVSILTDASVLRNLNQQQKFWAFGQTVQANIHIDKKNSAYAWVTYYTPGRFKNDFTATAKSPSTSPQRVGYRVYSSLRYRHLSLGWKHYFIGSFDSENIWNVYGYAGFGLLLGKADNRFGKSIDTTAYAISNPQPGEGKFKRLTLDAGLGIEFPLGTDIYLYTELRTWTPTSHYPSPYLYPNNYHVPSSVAVNGGLRITIQ